MNPGINIVLVSRRKIFREDTSEVDVVFSTIQKVNIDNQ